MCALQLQLKQDEGRLDVLKCRHSEQLTREPMRCCSRILCTSGFWCCRYMLQKGSMEEPAYEHSGLETVTGRCKAYGNTAKHTQNSAVGEGHTCGHHDAG
jgi:hypothetical protein